MQIEKALQLLSKYLENSGQPRGLDDLNFNSLDPGNLNSGPL